MIWQTPGFTSGITDPRSCEQTKILPWWRTWDGSKAMGNILWDPFPAGSMFWLQCHICAATQTELTVTSYLHYMPQIKQICSTLYRSCKKQSAGSEIRTHADLNSWSPPRWKGPSMLTRAQEPRLLQSRFPVTSEQTWRSAILSITASSAPWWEEWFVWIIDALASLSAMKRVQNQKVWSLEVR